MSRTAAGRARAAGAGVSLAAGAISAYLLLHAPPGQSFFQALMVLYSCLTLAAVIALPKRDCNFTNIGGIAMLLACTLLAYSSQNLLALLAAWILSIAPFLFDRWLAARAWRPRVAMLLSSAALAAAIAVIAAGNQSLSLAALRGRGPGGTLAFALLVVAVIFRKGICPAQAWVADAAESGPAIPTALLLNGHFGALLVAKVLVPLFPHATSNMFPVLSWLAMATALYTAIRALSENSPRRLLALIALSQSACILVGLESETAEGVAGALVHWFVVTVSTMGLFGILRLLEVRFGENLSASRYLGFAEHAPRLAVFFAVFSLSLVGLPGTLSFCSQDLLIHGTLQSHPLTGLVLPIATAMNAVSIFRLFIRLFLGKRRTGFTFPADALPRERLVFVAGVVFVVLGGLFPNLIVAQRPAELDSLLRPLHADAVVSLPSRYAHVEPRAVP